MSDAGNTCVALIVSWAAAGSATSAQANAAKPVLFMGPPPVSETRGASYHRPSDDALFRLRAYRRGARGQAVPRDALVAPRADLRSGPPARVRHRGALPCARLP